MSVYEEKYLREKLSRIIARQREGKVVIAACKDGAGLPEHGQGLNFPEMVYLRVPYNLPSFLPECHDK